MTFGGWIEGGFQEDTGHRELMWIGTLVVISTNDVNGKRYFQEGDMIDVEIIETDHPKFGIISVVHMLENRTRPSVIYFTDEVLFIVPPPEPTYLTPN